MLEIMQEVSKHEGSYGPLVNQTTLDNLKAATLMASADPAEAKILQEFIDNPSSKTALNRVREMLENGNPSLVKEGLLKAIETQHTRSSLSAASSPQNLQSQNGNNVVVGTAQKMTGAAAKFVNRITASIRHENPSAPANPPSSPPERPVHRPAEQPQKIVDRVSFPDQKSADIAALKSMETLVKPLSVKISETSGILNKANVVRQHTVIKVAQAFTGCSGNCGSGCTGCTTMVNALFSGTAKKLTGSTAHIFTNAIKAVSSPLRAKPSPVLQK